MSKTEEIEWNSVNTVTNGSGFYYSASHYETLLFTHDNTNDERMQSQYLTFRKFKTWRSVKGVKLKFWYGQVCIKSVYLGNDCQIEFFEGRENFDRLWQFKVFQIKWLQQKKTLPGLTRRNISSIASGSTSSGKTPSAQITASNAPVAYKVDSAFNAVKRKFLYSPLLSARSSLSLDTVKASMLLYPRDRK